MESAQVKRARCQYELLSGEELAEEETRLMVKTYNARAENLAWARDGKTVLANQWADDAVYFCEHLEMVRAEQARRGLPSLTGVGSVGRPDYDNVIANWTR